MYRTPEHRGPFGRYRGRQYELAIAARRDERARTDVVSEVIMNDGPDSAPMPEVRKGQGDVKLSREEFARRIGERFYDPAFDGVRNEVERIIDIAWNGYDQYRKSPRTRKAGAAFADPDFELPVEWLETRARILKAECLQRDLSSPRRILLVCGAARHDQTCPGEMSKTFRLAQLAREVIEESDGFECDVLDLSMLTAQYGRQILPCKACVSTAMPLCHWPCSCYPNHAMGQASDWMNELYPRWVAARTRSRSSRRFTGIKRPAC
jgi:hypothetical protein